MKNKAECTFENNAIEIHGIMPIPGKYSWTIFAIVFYRCLGQVLRGLCSRILTSYKMEL